MKAKCVILAIFQIFIFYTLLFSSVLNINLDGSGDYTEIQAGIDAACYGDTVLVFPGTYTENISFEGKLITVGSLYLITEDRSYIHNTIIDGNHNGSVVLFDETGETNDAVLCGFTVTNGSGKPSNSSFYNSFGGGIYIEDASPTLKNLIIEGNEASSGGGMVIQSSYADFEDLTIRDNHAHISGGGILHTQITSDVTFSSENRCNIYGNYAGDGNDIFLSEEYEDLVEIFIDTLSILNYDNHFVTDHPNLILDVQYGLFEQVNCNLYVSPTGSDDNTGFTEEDPLQTIHWALAKIVSDSLEPKTIYLAPGIYSHSTNDQYFALNGKSFVKIIGTGKEETIIDGENTFGCIFYRDDHNSDISDLSIINNYSFFSSITALRSGLNVSNIKISGSSNRQNGGISLSGGTIIGDNIEILNNLGREALRVGKHFETDASCIFTNLTIANNEPYYEEDGAGGAISIHNCIEAIFINTLVTNNTSYSDSWPISNFSIKGTENAYLINSTVCNNHSNYGSGMGFQGPGNLYIINSIIYDNSPYEFILHRSEAQGYIHFDYTNIDEQNDFIVVAGPDPCVPEIIWGEGYIRQEPQFVGGEEADPLYFQLSEDSPCINSGTPDTTGLNLPEYDLLGNTRIFQDQIDMGAYEWQGTSNNENTISTNILSLTNYPNPFNPSTTLKFDMRKAGYVNLEIYNIKGQKVRTLINQQQEAGYHTKVWQGNDDAGNPVGSGIYFYRLIVDGTAYPMRKCLLIK
ncbi:MAG: hypothetical protein APR54_12110 [Candidatus Cloacimonas sp. SDB]|nr:MAG: hypothetical protein APR54_12110 [Candidatus Cloacimonas sp. SDB]